MYKSFGYTYFDNGLKVSVDKDLLKYYFWHILKSPHTTLGLYPPAFKPHISIVLPNIHDQDIFEKSKNFIGQNVQFYYNGKLIKGGSNFTNYWMPIFSDDIEKIKDSLKINDNSIPHLTICNDKNFIKK